jgi:lipopolysaccharide assembly protein A
MNILIWFVRIVVVVLLVWFAAKNADIVTLNGIGGAVKAPLALILLGFFGAGLVLGLASALTSIFRLKREVRKLNRALQQRARTDAELPPASPRVVVTNAATSSSVTTGNP